MVAANLPGAELIERGLADLSRGLSTPEALLVCIGAPRLRAVGVAVPMTIDDPELRLYNLLAERYGDAAHSKYNALLRRLVSFERAAACVR
jgi:hypothetical protein